MAASIDRHAARPRPRPPALAAFAITGAILVLGLLLATPPAQAQRDPGQCVMFGTGTPDNGPGQLHYPEGVVLDTAGNAFIADTFNDRIVRIDAATDATTTIGTGFSGPSHVAIDTSGNLFIADTRNNRVVRVDPSGNQRTIATDLNSPEGVFVDSSGNVFVADTGNDRVLSVDPAGAQTLVAATGLSAPESVFVDSGANLFIADTRNNRVLRVDGSTGAQSTVGTDLGSPTSVFVDYVGNVLIADSGNQRIVRVDLVSGSQSVVADDLDPASLWIDYRGSIFSADTSDHQVLALGPACLSSVTVTNTSASSGSAWVTATPVGGGPGIPMISGTPVAIPSGEYVLSDDQAPETVFVCEATSADGTVTETYSRRFAAPAAGSVQCEISTEPFTPFDPASPQCSFFGTGISGREPGELFAPRAVFADNAGNVFISDTRNNRVLRVEVSTGAQSTISTDLNSPRGLFADDEGNVFIADFGNSRVVRVDAVTGEQSTVGTSLADPTAVFVDRTGNVFISDLGASRVVRVDARTGEPTTLSIPGLSTPQALAFDSAGNLFVLDLFQYLVVRVDAATSQASSWDLSLPGGLAVDAGGNVFVTENFLGHVTRFDAVTGEQTTIELDLNQPWGLSVDRAGNMFIANELNSRVVAAGPVCDSLPRKVEPVDGDTGPSSLTVTKTWVGGTGTASLTATPLYSYVNGGEAIPLTSGTPTELAAGDYVLAASEVPEGFASVFVCTATASDGTVTKTQSVKFTAPADGSVDCEITSTAFTSFDPTSPQCTAAFDVSPLRTAQRFRPPSFVFVDGSGNLYVSDPGADRVVRLDAVTGAETTVGTGLSQPEGLFVDDDQNVFIADDNNNRVVRIDAATGEQTTVGEGLSAPSDVFVDHAGTVYIADTGNHRIERVDNASGEQSTVFADNALSPTGVSVDGSGNLFFFGRFFEPQRIDAITGAVTAANVSLPIDSFVNVGGIAFTYSAGTALTLGYETGVATSVGTDLWAPSDLFVDEGGNVYIADSGNNRIAVIGPMCESSLTVTTTWVGGAGSSSLSAIPAVDGEAISLAGDGTVSLLAGDYTLAQTDTPPGFATTYSCAWIARDGTVTETRSADFKAPLAGSATCEITNSAYTSLETKTPECILFGTGTGGDNPGQLNAPTGVFVDENGNIYIDDTGNNRVVRVDNASGAQTTVTEPDLDFGQTEFIDNDANSFFVDLVNAQVIRVDSTTGEQTTVVSGLSLSGGVFVDGRASVFFVEPADHRVVGVGSVCSSVLTVTKTWVRGNGIASLTATPIDNNGEGSGEAIPLTSGTPVEITTGDYVLAASDVAEGFTSVFVCTAIGSDGTVAKTQSIKFTTPGYGSVDCEITSTANTRFVKSGPCIVMGTGTEGSGPGELDWPVDVAVDPDGNLFIIDRAGVRVVRVDATAGAETSVGSDLSKPVNVIADGNGNVFIADISKDSIVRIDAATGEQTTIGSGLDRPRDLFVDSTGTVLAGTSQGLVRIDGTTGVQTMVDSVGPIRAVHLDGQGNLFGISAGNVVRIDAVTGEETILITGSVLNFKRDIFVDHGGDVFALDDPGGILFIHNVSWNKSTGGGGRLFRGGYLFAASQVSGDNKGNVFVADTRNHRIVAVGPVCRPPIENGPALATVDQTWVGGTGTASLTATPVDSNGTGTGGAAIPLTSGTPTKLVAGDYVLAASEMPDGFDSVFVCTTIAFDGTVTKTQSVKFTAPTDGSVDCQITSTAFTSFDPTSPQCTVFGSGTPGSGPGQLSRPEGVFVDDNANLFISDTDNNRVLRVDANSGDQTTVGTGLSRPKGVFVDDDGNVFIADAGNDQIVRVDATTGDQTTIASGFNKPSDVFVDGAGVIYIADRYNDRVVTIDPTTGAQTTVASDLVEPGGVFVDGSGNLFIADPGRGGVLRIDAATQDQTTIPSGVGYPSFPSSVFVDGDGYLYLVDWFYGIEWKQNSGLRVFRFVSKSQTPREVFIDNDGNAFITDMTRHRIVATGPICASRATAALTVTNTWEGKTSTVLLTAKYSDGGVVIGLTNAEPVDLEPGNYTLAASAPSGFVVSDLVCTIVTDGGDQAQLSGPATGVELTLPSSSNTSCVITTTQQVPQKPTTITKNWVGDGPQPDVSFLLSSPTDCTVPVLSDVVTPVGAKTASITVSLDVITAPGSSTACTYIVSEFVPGGYTLTSTVPAGAINAGEAVTFTNTADPPGLDSPGVITNWLFETWPELRSLVNLDLLAALSRILDLSLGR